MNLALGEVTIAMSVVGGGRFSNPRIHTGSCSYADAQGAPQWSYDVFASSGVSDVTQEEISFAAETRLTTWAVASVTVNGANATLTSTGNPADAAEVGFEVTVSGLHCGPNTITTLASDSSTPAKSTKDTRWEAAILRCRVAAETLAAESRRCR